MGMMKASVLPLPVTCKGQKVSVCFSSQFILEGKQEDKLHFTQGTHRFCSNIFVFHEQRDGCRLKREMAEHWLGDAVTPPMRPKAQGTQGWPWSHWTPPQIGLRLQSPTGAPVGSAHR